MLLTKSSDHGPVAFPVSEPVLRQVPQPRPPHLPFRRISLPTAPTLLHRQSVASVASFESHPEEEGVHNVRSPGRRRARLDSSRRRDRSVKPDPSRLVKRRKIIDELYETEKTYVEGLDLVYSVCLLFSTFCNGFDTICHAALPRSYNQISGHTRTHP